MKKRQGSKPRFLPLYPLHPEAGFTLIEVMVSVAILTIIGFSIWAAFAGGLNVMRKIPVTGNASMQLLQLERAFRDYVGKIDFPIWLPDVELNPDDSIMEFPNLDGYTDYKLFFYTEQEDYSDEIFLIIESNSEAMDTDFKEEMEIADFKLKFGPFSKVSYDYVVDEEENLLGATLSVALMGNEDKEINLYAKIGGLPFWKP